MFDLKAVKANQMKFYY